MPINPDAVGTESEPYEVSWNSKDALLYAVGIGAGVDDLSFTTENTDGVVQQVFPTFPVVVGWGMGSTRTNIGTFNPAMLVHGQQSVTLHKPVPVSGKVRGVSRIIGIYDKGSGAVVSSSIRTVFLLTRSSTFSQMRALCSSLRGKPRMAIRALLA